MKGLRAVAALAILAVTNAFVFGGVLWNRSGEATGFMVFDQCELNSFKGWAGRHDTPRYISLYFQSRRVDANRVEDFGGYDADGKSLARRAYVVAKQGGAAWQEFVERQEHPEYYRDARLKLVLVDGGRDPAVLLQTYPEAEGRAVLPGYVGSWYGFGSGPEGTHWGSSADSVAIDSRHRGIAKEIRDARLALERAANEGSGEYVNPPCVPTHRVTVNWGRRFEPWISSIEPL